MGTWGSGSFENDDAMDWFAEVTGDGKHPPSRAAVEAALATASEAEYLEIWDGANALAAAEFVAAARLRPRIEPSLLAKVAALLEKVRYDESDALAHAALVALESACDRGRSEIAQLWAEAAAEDFSAWRASVADLRTRLG